jgi:hypothetical protein
MEQLLVWKFDGDGRDYLGGNDGTVAGGLIYDERGGIRGKAIGDTNNIGHMKLNSGITWGDTYTAAFWYAGTDSGTWRTLLCRDVGTYHHVLIQATTDEMGFYNAAWNSSGYVVDSSWHHYVVIMSASGAWVLYVDGVYETSLSGFFDTSTYPLDIVCNYSDASPTQGMNGSMDDLRIYDRGLTADEINLLYTSYGYGVDQKVRQYRNGIVYSSNQFSENL